jgi:hypothetical protein
MTAPRVAPAAPAAPAPSGAGKGPASPPKPDLSASASPSPLAGSPLAGAASPGSPSAAGPPRVTVKQATDMLLYGDIETADVRRLIFDLQGICANHADFAEEFLDRGGLQLIVDLVKKASNSGSTQSHLLLVLKALLNYVNAIDAFKDQPELVDKVYYMLSAPTDGRPVNLTVGKATLDLLIVLCHVLPNGRDLIHDAAKRRAGPEQKPYALLGPYLSAPDLLCVRNALLFLNVLLRKAREAGGEHEAKNLVFRWKESGLLNLLKPLTGIDDAPVKQQLAAFQKLADFVVPRSWEAAEKYRIMYEDMKKRYESATESLFVYQQQQVKVRLMKLEFQRATETLRLLGTAVPSLARLPHPTRRFEHGGGLSLKELGSDATVDVDVNHDDIKQTTALRKALLEKFLTSVDIRQFAEQTLGVDGASGGAGAGGAHRKRVGGTYVDPASYLYPGAQPPPTDSDDDDLPPDDDDDEPPPDDDGDDEPGALRPSRSGAQRPGAKVGPKAVPKRGAAGAAAARRPGAPGGPPSLPPTDDDDDFPEDAPGGARPSGAPGGAAAKGAAGGAVAAADAGAAAAAGGAAAAAGATTGGSSGSGAAEPSAAAAAAPDAGVAPGKSAAASAAAAAAAAMAARMAGGAAAAAAAAAGGGGGGGGAPAAGTPAPVVAGAPGLPAMPGAKLPGMPAMPGVKIPGMPGMPGAKTPAGAPERQWFKGPAPTKKMRPLHWDKMALTALEGTIWQRIHADKDGIDGGCDFDEFESLFSQKEVAKDEKKDAAKKEEKVMLVDAKTYMNFSIMLHKLPPVPTIQRAVLELDNATLKKDQIQALLAAAEPKSLSPDTVKEFTAKQSTKPVEEYSPPEQFVAMVLALGDVFKPRLSAWVFTLHWKENMETLRAPLTRASGAMQAVLRSQHLAYYLAVLLNLGNHMNHGSPKGNAPAVMLSILGKIDAAKDNRGKTSLMQHMLAVVRARNPAALDLAEELKCLWPENGSAASLKLDDLEKSVAEAEGAMNQFNNAVNIVKRLNASNPMAGSDPFVPQMTSYAVTAQTELEEAKRLLDDAKARYKELVAFFGYPEKRAPKLEEMMTEIAGLVAKVRRVAEDAAKDRKKAAQKGKKLDGKGIDGLVGQLQEQLVNA